LASEEFVARLDPEQFTRWQAVQIEPDEFLDGSYLEEGSVPLFFTISPFPDETFAVVETKYTIRGASVSWAGKIIGSDAGRIQIHIVGGSEQPEFVIRIFNGPQTIAILSTEMPGVYVSLEGNPHGPPSLAGKTGATSPDQPTTERSSRTFRRSSVAEWAVRNGKSCDCPDGPIQYADHSGCGVSWQQARSVVAEA
jgi:hypothetical protein